VFYTLRLVFYTLRLVFYMLRLVFYTMGLVFHTLREVSVFYTLKECDSDKVSNDGLARLSKCYEVLRNVTDLFRPPSGNKPVFFFF